MKTRITSFRIREDVHEALKSYCDRHGLKIGFIANQAIAEHLEVLLKAEAAAQPKEVALG